MTDTIMEMNFHELDESELLDVNGGFNQAEFLAGIVATGGGTIQYTNAKTLPQQIAATAITAAGIGLIGHSILGNLSLFSGTSGGGGNGGGRSLPEGHVSVSESDDGGATWH